MSRSVTAVRSGQDYQARFFWQQAGVRLLNPDGPVSRVGFEVSDVDGFDDVVVECTVPERDQFGRSVTNDYYQVKFHVDHGGDLTVESLTNPQAIGGTKWSFLERLKRAQTKLAGMVSSSRLHLVSTYPIDRTDPLARLVSTNEGGIRMDKLFAGSDGSSMGKLRRSWRAILGLDSDEELRELLYPLRISASAPTYHALQIDLETKLSKVGLRLPEGDRGLSPYEDLLWRLNGEGAEYFDADTLRSECQRAGLTCSSPVRETSRPLVAIQTFKRPGTDLTDTATELLSLLSSFDDRFLQPQLTWADVHSELAPFIESVLKRYESFDLQIDAHSSLAFAVGAQMPAKLGLDIGVLQRSRSGLSTWSVALGSDGPQVDVALDEVRVGQGNDVALVLAITHDILPEVVDYLKATEVPAGRIFVVRPASGSGQSAVRGAEDALAIADEAASMVKGRTKEERQGRLHLFTAAPNGLVFFLGQLSVSFGPVTLYEYDFEQTRTGGYEPAISLP